MSLETIVVKASNLVIGTSAGLYVVGEHVVTTAVPTWQAAYAAKKAALAAALATPAK